MIKNIFFILLLTQIYPLCAQKNTLSSKEAAEIIRTKDYKKTEHVQYNLDSVGTRIIRQLFSDKANHPDRISKKEYLDNPYRDTFEKEMLSSLIQILKKSETRKKVYTLTDEDSLLVFGRELKWKRGKIGQRGIWSFNPVDSTIAPNPYYQFFTFSIKMAVDWAPVVFVAKGFEPSGVRGTLRTLPKQHALIYDPVFTIGIPKVHLITENNNQPELPLIILGKDFISYPSNQLLLENVLKSSGHSDSTSRSLLVHLDALADYNLKELNPTTCKGFNLFNSKSCYQFTLTTREWTAEISGFINRKTKYIATINKSNKISYALVEEPQNLLSHVKSVFESRYNESNSEITFESKRCRRFIYEIETEPDRLTKQSKKYKAVYRKGKVSIKRIGL